MNEQTPPEMMPRCVVRRGDPIRDAIACIDNERYGIALVVDDSGRLEGTITDGDIRRAILARQDLEVTIGAFLAAKQPSAHPKPIVAAVGSAPETLLELMKAHSIRQIPLIDEQERVVNLAILDDLLPGTPPTVRAIIMAGGSGSRLRPLTEHVPKPMLPVGGRPLMEHIVGQLRQAGIQHVNVSTHYKPEKIKEYFGDGQAFGVDLNYVDEDRPLGTGGALGLMGPPKEMQLVINGDILTQVNLRAMVQFHQDNHAEMTVALRGYEVQVPYGVVECDGARVSVLKEKPTVGFLVNAGVYLLEPSVYDLIPQGQSFNMTDLVTWMLDAGRVVIGFPIREYWLDVGQHSDYAQAQDDMKNWSRTS